MYDSPAQIREGEFVRGRVLLLPALLCGSVARWPKIRLRNSNTLIFFIAGWYIVLDVTSVINFCVRYRISKPLFRTVGAKNMLTRKFTKVQYTIYTSLPVEGNPDSWSKLMKESDKHSWGSASRSMPPASAFRHIESQSGTGAFRYRSGSLIPIPDWPDAGQSDISAFKKGHTLQVHTAGGGNGYTLHVKYCNVL